MIIFNAVYTHIVKNSGYNNNYCEVLLNTVRTI